jgi:hypothetical protein
MRTEARQLAAELPQQYRQAQRGPKDKPGQNLDKAASMACHER